jgi:hypothetical protein
MESPQQYPLGMFAHGRSGDKGNHANVAVIAYTARAYQWLREELTSKAVLSFFRALEPSRVERYEAPNLLALNFVLYDVLAGGASRSLRIDTQGKTLALTLLKDLWLDLPEDWRSMVKSEGRTMP